MRFATCPQLRSSICSTHISVICYWNCYCCWLCVTTTQRQQQGRVAPAYFIITAIFELGSMNFSRLTYLHFIIARPFYWRKSFSLFLCVYFIYICFGTQTRTVDQKDTAAHSYGCMKICCSFSFPPFAKLAAVNGASSGKRKSAEGLLTCSWKTWSLCRVFLSIWINSRFILRDMSKRRQSCQWKNLISSSYCSWGINKKDKLFKVFVCH